MRLPAGQGSPAGLAPGLAREVERLGGYRVGLRRVRVKRWRVELLEVADLETYVDRQALLAGEDPAEPPYWAHLWAGALVLARHVAARWRCRGARVLDLGCGLGLAGIVAALGGAEQVTFLDRESDALVFAAASAARNRCHAVDLCCADFTRASLDRRFDLILGAEVLYDAAAYAPLVRFLTGHLAPGGTALLADAHRSETRAFYAAVAAAGCGLSRTVVTAREEGLPLRVDLVAVCGEGAGGGRQDAAHGYG